MTSYEGTSLQSYVQQVLVNHGISAPDGRPLYAYRLTETQFEILQHTLRSKLDSYLKFGTLGALTNSNNIFCALFVLYAAEWWRRRYDGSKWSWEPILAELGVPQDSWSSIQRNDCVARGLNKWQLKISETTGYRYLGAIAVQGGLPMQLLATARGNIGRILRRVLGLARGGTVGFAEIRGWIASLKDELPKSYQKEDIYVLLTEVITSVLDLRKEAGLTKSAEAIAQLDQQMPGWRNKFPLPVEDNEVQGLIEQLIRDVADVQEKKLSCTLRVERSLESRNSKIWNISSNIALPETLSTQDICSFFRISDCDSIPRIIELVIEASGHNLSISARRMAGHDRYRLERCPNEFNGHIAMGEHKLTLRTSDGRHWMASLRNGGSLDEELPWIFEWYQQNSPRLVLQGGGSVQTVETLIAIPSGWKVAAGFNSSCFPKAFIEVPDREVYEVKGDATISDTHGHHWTVKTGQASATEESYQWVGDRMWEEFLWPNLAFRERPILYEIHGEASESRIREHLLNWQPPNISAGPVVVTYKEHQELRCRSRMVLLPKDAKVSLEPKGLNSGIIHLCHWQAANARLTENTGVKLHANPDGDSLTLICSTQDATPPEWVEIEVIWEGNATPARIRLPFPSEGARAFDASGTELLKDAWLSAQRLTGVRLVAMIRSPVSMELRFRLRHTTEHNNVYEACHKIRAVNGSSRIDIRLQDYANDIDRLLAADELLDAWVEVTLSLNCMEALRLRVSRYACLLERVGSNVCLPTEGMKCVTPEILTALPVYALRLEQPGEEAIVLEAKLSEGVPTGAWEFISNTRESGSWLIYPGADSLILFRPTLWIIPGESSGNTELTYALSIEDRESRAAELDRVIKKMSADFLNACWGDLEWLAGHLGHLPLATLDLWRQLAHSPTGMAALAIRLNNLPASFLRRFSLEQPFVWELVPIKEWIAAADQLKQQCVAWFGEAAYMRQFTEFLSVRVEELTTYQPALSKILGILKSVILNDECKEIKMMRAAESDAYFQYQIFNSDQSALQRLLRDHADDGWPTKDSVLFAWINSARQNHLFMHLFPKESFTFRDGVIGLPVMLAIQVATNRTGEWFSHSERIHILRTYQAFDPDWFTEAFDLTIARCLSTGVMKI